MMERTTDRLVPIGVLSQRSGCSADTIRFYEKVGVLPQARRTEAGRRVYAGSDIARVTFVRRARDLGFSIDEIRSLLALAESETGACDRVRSVASDHLDSIAGKIADLQTMQAVLADLIAGCERGDGTTCPLLTQLWNC